MTIEDIKALIKADESRTLELKKSTGELKDGLHTACAFLNTDGGWLIFGITPNSLKIVGQQVTDDTKREISQALAGIEPAYDIQPIYVDVPDSSGNKVIAFHFDGWKLGQHPYTFRGRPYYKIESTTKIMPRNMYDERILAYQPQSYCWETYPAKDVSISDLNHDRIIGCIRLGVEGGRIPESALTAPIEDTLAKWKLTVNGVPTNGAAMLFSNNIYPYDNFLLRLARFRGVDKLEFIDNQRAEGNFFDLLDAGMAFLFKHLNLSGKITNRSLMREERLEIPVSALRETLINALCHRQWEKQNLTISIAVYDDRVEIANPGAFPPQIPIENIKDSHESYPYNRNIAHALYRSTYLESWGSGIHRIIEACREQGVEDPIWHWDGAFIYVTFKRPLKIESNAKLKISEGNVSQNAARNTAQNVVQNAVLNIIQNVAQNLDERIIQIIKSNPSIKREDIANLLSVNKKTIERHLKKLGVKWEGHSKTGHWHINTSSNTQQNYSGDIVASYVAQNTARNVAQNLNERIIQIIKSNPSIKREDIANLLSVNKKTIERHLKKLGIKWEGHSKTGHWHIKKL